jgi:hypothetical protein
LSHRAVRIHLVSSLSSLKMRQPSRRFFQKGLMPLHLDAQAFEWQKPKRRLFKESAL